MTDPTTDAVEILNRTFVKGSVERRQSIDREREILENAISQTLTEPKRTLMSKQERSKIERTLT